MIMFSNVLLSHTLKGIQEKHDFLWYSQLKLERKLLLLKNIFVATFVSFVLFFYREYVSVSYTELLAR